MIKRIGITLPAVLLPALFFGGLSPIQSGEPPGRLLDLFAIDGRDSILEEAHCGIINGKLTVGIPFRDVARIEGLWAPPLVSSDFGLSVTVMGGEVPTERYVWWPFQVQREGARQEIQIRTRTVLARSRRAGVLAMSFENRAAQDRAVPIEIRLRGTLDRNETWEFAAPRSSTATRVEVITNSLVLSQGNSTVVVCGTSPGVQWDASARTGRVNLKLKAGGHATVDLAFALGDKAEAISDSAQLAADPQEAIRQAADDHLRQIRDLFSKLPRLESDNRPLVRLYERSLVHFLMNRWEVPEFVLQPYYGTGSVRGGCVCNYLWNFGETWELLPLYDPAAAREHIKQFLRINLTAHFAFLPVTGKGFGPWYMVNQEKIIGLIYYYVKNTGDAAFLADTVEGRTIMDHVIAHARFGEAPDRPVRLIDYGPSNSHLELRRGFPYNHTMPDLNGRRYANYLMAARLAEVAGTPAPQLRERAESLKRLLKQKLWNPRIRWFEFLDSQGRREARYTLQMFKLIASGVLDDEEEAGLLSHLNEREFLSEQGFHSLSKLDIAYDQVDIDNGGGGSCTCFPPQIAERLYKAGHAAQADDILRRLLWWGARMPYWGDSLVANQVDYRRDTPLQCTIDGVTVAQCIVFGMFGIEARFDGGILVSPHLPAFAREIRLTGIRLRGKILDVAVADGRFTVKCGGREIESSLGDIVLVEAGGMLRRQTRGAVPIETLNPTGTMRSGGL